MGSLLGRSRRQRVLRATLIVILLLIFFTASQRGTISRLDEAAWAKVPKSLVQHDYSGNCDYAIATEIDDIAVTLKIGTTEAAKKLPAQLRTHLGCISDLLIVSDLAGSAFGHHVEDIVSRVPPQIRDSDRVFSLYLEQQKLRELDLSLFDIGHELSADVTWRNTAWMLDRFKFTHMLNYAWTELPDKKWYVFVEADTYVFWPNLARWLKTLNPHTPLYMGSKESMHGIDYVYGGSGIVVSNAAMRMFTQHYGRFAEIWDQRNLDYCCGDYALGVFFSEMGVNVTDTSDITNQQNLWTIPYGPTGVYCQDVVSLHHMTSALIDTAWRLEQQEFIQGTGRINYQRLREIMLPRERSHPARRVDWDNGCPRLKFDLATEEAKTAIYSEDKCMQLCAEHPDCFQYLFRQEEACRLYSCYSLGKAVQSYKGKSWVSGWLHEKFENWEESQQCQ